MLIEIKDWRDDLRVGDLTYYKQTLLKVIKVINHPVGLKRKYRGMSGKTVKFRKIGRVRLKPYDIQAAQPHG